jgi:hypothetical protein
LTDVAISDGEFVYGCVPSRISFNIVSKKSKACAIVPLDSLAHFRCWDSGSSDAKISCALATNQEMIHAIGHDVFEGKHRRPRSLLPHTRPDPSLKRTMGYSNSRLNLFRTSSLVNTFLVSLLWNPQAHHQYPSHGNRPLPYSCVRPGKTSPPSQHESGCCWSNGSNVVMLEKGNTLLGINMPEDALWEDGKLDSCGRG